MILPFIIDLLTLYFLIHNIAFHQQWLVGIEVMKPYAANSSWNQLTSLPKKEINTIFSKAKIVLCKRDQGGHFYVATGFHDMIHFTVGPEGRKRLTKFFDTHSVLYHELKGLGNDKTSPDWFRVHSLGQISHEQDPCKAKFLQSLTVKVTDLANVMIPHLVKVCFNIGSIIHLVPLSLISFITRLKHQRMKEFKERSTLD